MLNYSILDRKIIKISGSDRKNFLQGLITNDINLLEDQDVLIYSLMLTATGNFFCDFFINQTKDNLYLDVEESRIDEIFKKLSLYKLSANIELKISNNLKIIFLENKTEKIKYFPDPRSNKIGFRAILNDEELSKIQNDSDFCQKDLNFYNKIRLNLKIADHTDLTIKKSIPAEYGFFDLNCINFNKGCYIGQEVMARIKYKGVIRKKIYLIEISDDNPFSKNDEINYNDRKIGNILSSIKINDQILALAILKNSIIEEDPKVQLQLNDKLIKII
jgi:folate-binding protein YgfZ